MKKIASLFALLAFLATLIGVVLCVIKLINRKRGLFCYDDDENDYDDIIIGSDQHYYAEDFSDLSANDAEGALPADGSESASEA